jgi:hypothetical protein
MVAGLFIVLRAAGRRNMFQSGTAGRPQKVWSGKSPDRIVIPVVAYYTLRNVDDFFQLFFVKTSTLRM